MNTVDEKYLIFYHPSDKKTVWGRFWERSDAAERQYTGYPGIYQCARTKAPVVPPRSITLLYKFAALFLLPICVEIFCLVLSKKGDSLLSIFYGFIIPNCLFANLADFMKASISWEPINQKNVPLKEASNWYCAYRQKNRKTILLFFLCISLPLSLLIFLLHK